jgi:hypothetical protein
MTYQKGNIIFSSINHLKKFKNFKLIILFLVFSNLKNNEKYNNI